MKFGSKRKREKVKEKKIASDFLKNLRGLLVVDNKGRT